jgi:hypothetical protein
MKNGIGNGIKKETNNGRNRVTNRYKKQNEMINNKKKTRKET